MSGKGGLENLRWREFPALAVFFRRLCIVANRAERLESIRFAIQAGNENVPCPEPFRANDGQNVIGSQIALLEQFLATFTAAQLALFSCFRIDAIFYEGAFDAFVFGRPAGTA